MAAACLNTERLLRGIVDSLGSRCGIISVVIRSGRLRCSPVWIDSGEVIDEDRWCREQRRSPYGARTMISSGMHSAEVAAASGNAFLCFNV